MYKKIFSILVVILVYSLITVSVIAQEKYPEKPIQAIVGFAPGSFTDANARVLAEFLKKYLGQPIVVINKPGGAGAIAGNELFKSKHDGYTIGMFHDGMATPEYALDPERYIYKMKDIQPVARWVTVVPTIFARYDAPWKSLVDFIDYSKKNPNKLRWGHPGRGNMMWIIGTLVIQKAAIKLLEVPFEGDAQMMAALLGNHIDIYVNPLAPTNIAQIEANKAKALAFCTQKRVDRWPDVPTVEETGYPIEIPVPYLGIFVPKGTPKEMIAKLSSAIKKAIEDPEYMEKAKKAGVVPSYMDPMDFEEYAEKFGKAKWDIFKKLGLI